MTRKGAKHQRRNRRRGSGVGLRNWHTYMDGICRQSRRISVCPNRGLRLCAFWNSLRTCSASSFGRHPPRSAAGRTARKQKIRRQDIVSVHVTACLFGYICVCVCVSEPHMWAGSMRAPIDRILGTHGRWQPRRRRRASSPGSAPPQPQLQPHSRTCARPAPGESRKSLAGEQIKL